MVFDDSGSKRLEDYFVMLVNVIKQSPYLDLETGEFTSCRHLFKKRKESDSILCYLLRFFFFALNK